MSKPIYSSNELCVHNFCLLFPVCSTISSCPMGQGITNSVGNVCTTTTDVVCSACKPGFYHSSSFIGTACVMCSAVLICSGGLGLTNSVGSTCSASINNVCGRCNANYFNANNGDCTRCSPHGCPVGQGNHNAVGGSACSTITDNVCANCDANFYYDFVTRDCIGFCPLEFMCYCHFKMMLFLIFLSQHALNNLFVRPVWAIRIRKAVSAR